MRRKLIVVGILLALGAVLAVSVGGTQDVLAENHRLADRVAVLEQKVAALANELAIVRSATQLTVARVMQVAKRCGLTHLNTATVAAVKTTTYSRTFGDVNLSVELLILPARPAIPFIVTLAVAAPPGTMDGMQDAQDMCSLLLGMMSHGFSEAVESALLSMAPAKGEGLRRQVGHAVAPNGYNVTWIDYEEFPQRDLNLCTMVILKNGALQ